MPCIASSRRSVPCSATGCGSFFWRCWSRWALASSLSGGRCRDAVRRRTGTSRRMPFERADRRSARRQLVKRAWRRQRELRDRRLERRAIRRHHLVRAPHRAYRRADLRSTRVLEPFTGLQQRLVPHHADAAHFAHVVVRVGDDPVPADQLGRHRAQVLDDDGVGEDKATLSFARLLGYVRGVRADGDVVAVFHGSWLRNGSEALHLISDANGAGAVSRLLELEKGRRRNEVKKARGATE